MQDYSEWVVCLELVIIFSVHVYLRYCFIYQSYVKYPLPTFCLRESLHSSIYLFLMIIANVKHSLLMV